MVADPVPEPSGRRRSRLALAGLCLLTGTLHLAVPRVYDELVPGPARAWTLGSGVAELAVGGLLARRRTEQVGGWAAVALFLGVYPANIWDTIDHPPTDARGVASLVRLPLQLPLLWWAWRHTRPRP